MAVEPEGSAVSRPDVAQAMQSHGSPTSSWCLRAAERPVVGRLAPSPTGRLHIGNAYAALAAWLSARSQGGRVILRIEDIDGPRTVPGADGLIMDDYRWLGLDWDGDPVWQSRRLPLYERAMDDLASRGLIYPCFCSRADLRAASAPHDEDGFLIYPGTCRRLSDAERRSRIKRGDRHSWRLAMPVHACVEVRDRIYGLHGYDLARDCGDVVLRRSDGLFAYQLAVTVDDAAQGVTDIVRGRDLLRSSAIQVWLRHVLFPQAPEPSFAHVPILTDARGTRLAKRDKAIDLGQLREGGVRPENVIGYCAWLLGLLDGPRPMKPADLVGMYDDALVRRDVHDRVADMSVLFRM